MASVRLEPAGGLWGQTCSDTQRQLHAQFGQDFQAAVIGPAGERLVRYATVSHAGRHAGRGGSGAVLGSKNLKAILVRGTQRCDWADTRSNSSTSPDNFPPSRWDLPRPSTVNWGPRPICWSSIDSTRCRRETSSTAASRAWNGSPPNHSRRHATQTRASCVACTIGCEHIYGVRPASQTATQSVRVEYENLFALGSLCGVSDPEAVLTASRQCDELGLDTISAGGTIAFAMECVERGLLDAPWLTFGSGAALLQAIDLIARREGLGDALAQGSRHLAESLGPQALAFAPHVKGLEIPGYEPRAMQTLALGLAVGTRGADHNRSGAAEVDFSARADRRHLTTVAAAWPWRVRIVQRSSIR